MDKIKSFIGIPNKLALVAFSLYICCATFEKMIRTVGIIIFIGIIIDSIASTGNPILAGDVAFVRDSLNGSYPALQATLDYSNWGYNDWFLPSKDDLIKARQNLALNGLGNFQMTPTTGLSTGYWSSSLMANGVGAIAPVFGNGINCGCAYFENYWVRPVRYF